MLPRPAIVETRPFSAAIIGAGPRGPERAAARGGPRRDVLLPEAGVADNPAGPLHPEGRTGAGSPTVAYRRPRPVVEALPGLGDLKERMGPSSQVDKVLQQVMQVANSPLTALIQGETGTGKELVARAIHHLSLRRRGPLIALDCGAIPETLMESELFGYERGAFTGADQRKEGHFQLADGGSLFLDEIANLSLATQLKLLRALQERVVQPLGGRRPLPVDVRIIASSNVPLEGEVRAGRFRQDLFYRLNEFSINLPPLRERLEDVLYLANRFLAEASLEFGRAIHVISDEAADVLLAHPWPGNVRQLRSVMRRAALLSQEGIGPEHLPALGPETSSAPPVKEADSAPQGRSLKVIAAAAAAVAERQAISQALQETKGNKSAVARLLGVDYKTIQLKLKRYGLCAREFLA
jgi:transcriptional regulator with GAF, ATPase, and Fis domain